MSRLLLKSDAAPLFGVRECRLHDLRVRGLIPEVVQAGRYFLYPEDKIASIRQRLIEQGHIKPSHQPLTGAAHAG